MIAIIIIIGLVIFAIIYSILTYKKIVKAKIDIRKAWHELDASLKEKFNLLPRYIILLQRIAFDQKATLQKAADTISYYKSAKNKADKIASDVILNNVINDLFTIYQEKNVELQDSEKINFKFHVLTEQISSLRQNYNLKVKKYNDKVLKGLSKIIALLGHFKPDIYYEVNISNNKEEIDSL